MKQILQNLKTGATEVTELPSPRGASGQLLIHTTRTLVSAGTERMLVEFGKAGWIDKARQQPDKMRMVLEKVRTDGLAATAGGSEKQTGPNADLGLLQRGGGVRGGAIGRWFLGRRPSRLQWQARTGA